MDSLLAIYKALEKHYYKLTAKRPDPELSLEVIDLLLPLYGADERKIQETIDEYFLTHEAMLHKIYDSADDDKTAISGFFYQPEALMILDRLEADQIGTRKKWNTKFPEEELESVATAFGISFD